MNNKTVLTGALVSIAAILTLAFLYFVWPSHYTYAPFHDTWFLREKTNIFNGKVTIQILDLAKGEWRDYR